MHVGFQSSVLHRSCLLQTVKHFERDDSIVLRFGQGEPDADVQTANDNGPADPDDERSLLAAVWNAISEGWPAQDDDD